MHFTAIGGRLPSIDHPVVANYAGYAQSIILEDFRSAFGLRGAMRLELAPLRNGLFVAPEGQ